MTASIQNSRSALKVLEDALEAYETVQGPAPEKRLTGRSELLSIAFNLRILTQSLRKCLDSLDQQIRFYQSATGTGRAYWIERDGKDEYVHAQHLKSLHIALPGAAEDAVIHGKPEALEAVATALGVAGQAVTGPADLHTLADQLGKAAFKGADAPPDKGKAKANGLP